MTPAEIQLHAVMPRSRANGPGLRAVVWFQGCTLGCPGCFNPSTHASTLGRRVPVEKLVAQIVGYAGEIEGVTVSGGEPLQQRDGLEVFLRAIRSRTQLSIVLFSGYSRQEIERMETGPAILGLVDVLIAGRYVQRLHDGRSMRASSNQELCFFTTRYAPPDFCRIPRAEISIDRTGRIEATGIQPLVLAR